MRIKIVKAPPGQAPLWVRESWIGIEANVVEDEFPSEDQMGIFGGAPQNLGGFRVAGEEVFISLRSKSHIAFNWWVIHAPLALCSYLIFAKEVCEVVEE